MVAVNPNEGQVAIPYAKAPGGHAVGRLTTRAIRWIEETTGEPLDQIYEAFARRAIRGSNYLPVSVASAVIWAGIENERRNLGNPLPEYTIDDADEIVDQVGLDDSYAYALALIQLSLPFKARTKATQDYHREHGLPDPMDPLKAVAAGTGMPSSPPDSKPDSPTPTSGD